MDQENQDAMIEYFIAVKAAAASYAAFVAASPPGKVSEIDAAAAAYVDSTEAGKTLKRIYAGAKEPSANTALGGLSEAEAK